MPDHSTPRLQHLFAALLATCFATALPASVDAAPDPRVAELASREKQPLLETMRQLVSIESGSRDLEGLEKISSLIADRLRDLGGAVAFIEPGSPAAPDVYRMKDTPEKIGRIVHATFQGKGQGSAMLVAHMDTVYQRGQLEKQPFRIDGDKAFGLGIADDKQGIAVILHTLAMLKAAGFQDYGRITVLINADEEISSPGSRATITRLAAEHDMVMSFEGSPAGTDKLAFATAGIGSVSLTVHGKASHAGSAPEKGVNAVVELSHQILQTRDLSDPQSGLKMNWTIAQGGTNRNVIPAEATATADVRVIRVADFDRVEQQVRERIGKTLVPDARVEMTFERRRPPLELTPASQALAERAKVIYRELDRDLVADAKVEGGGTDAAFAGLRSRGAVVERFGLQGYGAHSGEAEYVLLESIEPRLYLATCLLMDIGAGKPGKPVASPAAP